MDYNELLDRTETLINHAKETWERDEVQERIGQAQQFSKDLVDKYPLGSIAGAVIIGFVIGKLLSRGED